MHKKMLAVVVEDVAVDGEYEFERRTVGTSPAQLRSLADWFVECEVVMQVAGNRVQLQNRLECLLEEAQIKLSSLVSDVIGASARRMLQALADGETSPATIAALGSRRLHAHSGDAGAVRKDSIAVAHARDR